MTIRLTSLRDRLLDTLLRVDGDATLAGAGESIDATTLATSVAGAAAAIYEVGLRDEGHRVDYGAIRASEGYAAWRATLGGLAQADPREIPDRDGRLSFWINLYNLLVIDAVIRHGVERSVTEGWAGLLAFFRRAAYRVAGARYSLEEIEHGVLRANRGHPYLPGAQFAPDDPRRRQVIHRFEPRIHFALNCASRSCPPLRLFEPDDLETQLERATRDFLARGGAELDPDGKTLWLSTIFNWFARDFGGRERTIDFVLAHLPDGEPRSRIAAGRDRIDVRYRRYDWGLNESGQAAYNRDEEPTRQTREQS